MGGKVSKKKDAYGSYSILHPGVMEYDVLMLNEKKQTNSKISVKENKTNIEIIVKYDKNILISK